MKSDLQANITKVKDPSDPLRCQSMTRNGQCMNVAIEGVRNCAVHNGNAQLAAKERQGVRLYRLGKWREQVSKMADNPKLKSLSEEIGILRVMLDETISRCQSEHDLIMASATISDLIGKIERLVISCHKLDKDLNVMLDRNSAMQLADTLLAIIIKHVKDEEALEEISTAFENAVKEMPQGMQLG